MYRAGNSVHTGYINNFSHTKQEITVGVENPCELRLSEMVDILAPRYP